MPSNFVAYFGNRKGMYSPGICPMSYTEGCPFPSSDAKLADGQTWAGGPVVPGETARICCPEGYTCHHDTTTYPDVQWRKCIRAGPNSMTRYTGSDGVVTTTKALAYAIQVRWQSSDLSILETDPTVPGSTYTTPETTMVSSDGRDGGDGGGRGGGGGGTSTTVLVVGIVVPVLSLLLGIVGFLFWRHHYRNKYGRARPPGNSSTTALKNLPGGQLRLSSALTLHTESDSGSPMGKDGGGGQKHDYANAVPSEMDAVVVHEVDGRTRNRGAELPADEWPQEMPDHSAVFVAELADTSIANTSANDFAGKGNGRSAARRKSLREPGHLAP